MAIIDIPLGANDQLYCGFNGTDGSTTILDDHGGHTFIVGGNAQLDTDIKKFEESALLLDGVNSDLQIAVDSTDFLLGTSDFTFETFINIHDDPPDDLNTWHYLWNKSGSLVSVEASYWFGLMNDTDGTRLIGYGLSDNGYSQSTGLDPWNYTLDTWYHVAFCREGTDFALFIDGVRQWISTGFTTNYYANTENFTIGSDRSAGYINASFDAMRVSIGTCLYSPTGGNFTPPALDPTSRLKYYSGGSYSAYPLKRYNGATWEEYPLKNYDSGWQG